MLNSLSHYNLSESPDGLTYQFATDSGAQYTAYFMCMDCYHPALDNTYSFSFERSGTLRIPYDSKIKETILYILELFFQNNVNSVIYVCDSSDCRESSRNRLFDNWYRRFSKLPLEKHCVDADATDYHVFASLFISRSNPNKHTVIEAFHALKDQYYTGKV